MRYLLQALLCLVLILGVAACAAPTDGSQMKEPHSVNNHIPPPGFPVSTSPKQTERYCGGETMGPTPRCDEPREYCHFKMEDTCGFTDAPGVCRDRPQMCTMDFTPVCGCDGETYPNACAANSNGISVSAKGECKS